MRIWAIILGVLFLIAGLILIVVLSNYVGQCESGMVKLASLLDPETNGACSTIKSILIISYGIAILGAVLFLAGLFIPKKERKKREETATRSTTAKATYPIEDEEYSCHYCGNIFTLYKDQAKELSEKGKVKVKCPKCHKPILIKED